MAMHESWPKKYEISKPVWNGFSQFNWIRRCSSLIFKPLWCSLPNNPINYQVPKNTLPPTAYEILGDRQRKACNIIQVRGFNMWSCSCQEKKIQVRPCSTFFSNTTVDSNLKRQIKTLNNGAKSGAMFFPIVTLPRWIGLQTRSNTN